MKRIPALTLALLMLLSSCGSTVEVEETAADTAPVQTEPVETEQTPLLPEDLTFDGRDFHLLSSYYNDYCKITKEEATGEVLNDAIYDMEIRTEERLDVNFIEDQREYMEAIRMSESLVAAGDNTYAGMNQLDRFSIDLMVKGYLRPLEDAEHLDLTAPWWHPDVTEEMSLGGHTFYAASASNILMYVDTSAIYINTSMAENLGVSVDGIYEAVREGSWTQDQLMEYASLAKADLNGDGEMTRDDQWGMMCFDENILGTSLITAGDRKSLDKDENDNLTLLWKDEQYVNLLENAYNIFHHDAVLTEKTASQFRHKAVEFAEGRSLFMHGFFMAVDQLEEMEDDYTIVPIPKFDAAQDRYICANYDVMTYIMPKFVSDTELFGAVLEWLSYEGSAQVTDAYIETTMKYKAAREETMAEMVQMCLDASMIDIGGMYCYNWCSYDMLYFNVIRGGSLNFASYAAAQDKAIQTRLTEIADAVANVQ
ncbi:MAG: hypothetical protein IJB15_05590 [Clostridia bacterium]|nr:hypothetical protein [Clostridia bacterium]